MPTCYLTGVLLPLKDAYVLDVTVANVELRRLREQVAILEHFCTELGRRDAVTVTDEATGATHERYDSRLVSATMAHALGTTFPNLTLFLPWSEARRKRMERSESLREAREPRYPEGPDAPEPGNER